MPRGVRTAGVEVKRRRIREIVAAAQTDYLGEPTRPDEITVTVRRDAETERRVEVGLPWGVFVAATKREALWLSLAAHGWGREWPGLTGDERWLLRRGKPFCAIARSQGRGDLWLWEHLREPVALPEEARRG